MRVAVFGGSYNPVHNGHLFVAQELVSELASDLVIFVPAFIPPHKTGREITEARHRCAMLRLAIEGNHSFSCDFCEIEREGKSYTIDTLEDIIGKYDIDGRPALLIGDDQAKDFYKWKSPEKIAEISDIIVAHRDSMGRIPLGFPHKYMENQEFPLSSSEIRVRIGTGKAWRYLLPEAVRKYIIENGLYGYRSDNSGS
jgi:nicotinate-nucleotide adenylyltransferase